MNVSLGLSSEIIRFRNMQLTFHNELERVQAQKLRFRDSKQLKHHVIESVLVQSLGKENVDPAVVEEVPLKCRTCWYLDQMISISQNMLKTPSEWETGTFTYQTMTTNLNNQLTMLYKHCMNGDCLDILSHCHKLKKRFNFDKTIRDFFH